MRLPKVKVDRNLYKTINILCNVILEKIAKRISADKDEKYINIIKRNVFHYSDQTCFSMH